jgi:predicted ester cyclase
MIQNLSDQQEAFRRIEAVWQGEADVSTLDALVTQSYIGHIGSRDRDLAGLKHDIAAYRQAAPDVRFRVEHQFGEGQYVATRVTAHATDPTTGEPIMACGLNISRWEDGLLAEEWAVWETLASS